MTCTYSTTMASLVRMDFFNMIEKDMIVSQQRP